MFGTYPKQIDFFLVHGFTGNHAVRVVFSKLPEQLQRQLLKVNLLGFLTDYAVQRNPKIEIDFLTGDLVNVFKKYLFNHCVNLGYKDTEPEENMTWDNIVKRTILTDEEHVLKVVRCLIYYMETVPLSQRSALFTEEFLRRCAFKMVDLIQELEAYRF